MEEFWPGRNSNIANTAHGRKLHTRRAFFERLRMR